MGSTTLIWQKATGPSSGYVKEHFVQARKQELHRKDQALQDKVANILINHPSFARKKIKLKTNSDWPKDLHKIYNKISDNLRSRELTINFDADRWFTTENKYDSYTQIYERSGGGSGNFLVGDKQNPAHMRAKIDDVVTIPQTWTSGSTSTSRGLNPGHSKNRIAQKMQFGNQGTVGSESTNDKVKSLNPHFDPKTKQVFAALNYGRRKYGSSMEYGDAHLVLHNRFKTNALYFGRDTFYLGTNGTDSQCTYNTLGAVIAHAHPKMVDDIINSCYIDVVLADNKGGSACDFLLEAHLFDDLTFKGNIAEIRLPSRYMGSGSGVVSNALKFADKHNTVLRYV